MPKRPDWDDWAMGIVNAVARRGDCTRRQVGAVILGVDHRVWGLGFNGSYPGGPSCLEGGCPRGRHYETIPALAGLTACESEACDCDDGLRRECACGGPWPCPDAVAPGSSYDTGPGVCISSHAEANAVADALRRAGGDLDGCVMYVSCEPCEGCVRHVRNTTRIEAIIWPKGVVALP